MIETHGPCDDQTTQRPTCANQAVEPHMKNPAEAIHFTCWVLARSMGKHPPRTSTPLLSPLRRRKKREDRGEGVEVQNTVAATCLGVAA